MKNFHVVYDTITIKILLKKRQAEGKNYTFLKNRLDYQYYNAFYGLKQINISSAGD